MPVDLASPVVVTGPPGRRPAREPSASPASRRSGVRPGPLPDRLEDPVRAQAKPAGGEDQPVVPVVMDERGRCRGWSDSTSVRHEQEHERGPSAAIERSHLRPRSAARRAECRPQQRRQPMHLVMKAPARSPSSTARPEANWFQSSHQRAVTPRRPSARSAVVPTTLPAERPARHGSGLARVARRAARPAAASHDSSIASQPERHASAASGDRPTWPAPTVQPDARPTSRHRAEQPGSDMGVSVHDPVGEHDRTEELHAAPRAGRWAGVQLLPAERRRRRERRCRDQDRQTGRGRVVHREGLGDVPTR